jgi:hypothetical protein
MTTTEKSLSQLHADLGYRRLNPAWVKLEILLGLLAAGAGLFLGQWTLSRPDADIAWGLAAAGLALFVLGGYLTLAGHRSHLYRSMNDRTAYLAERIESLQANKGRRE